MYSFIALIVVILIVTRLIATTPRGQAASEDETGAHRAFSKVTIGLIIVAAVAGGFLRLYGLDRSLWLDEFGTLWVAEGSLTALTDRGASFQAQSPFYYSIIWLFLQTGVFT